MKLFSRIRLIHLGAVLVIAGMLGYTAYYYFVPVVIAPNNEIQDFNEERDTADILKIFDENWYWLVEGNDYDPVAMLKTKTPSTREPRYKGQLHIKVLRKDDQFIGFTTYYLRAPGQGQVQFLAVNPEFRGKGYGEQLMNYALQGLKKLGAQTISLVTRTINYPAQKVYKKTGFTEVYRNENGLVFFERKV